MYHSRGTKQKKETHHGIEFWRTYLNNFTIKRLRPTYHPEAVYCHCDFKNRPVEYTKVPLQSSSLVFTGKSTISYCFNMIVVSCPFQTKNRTRSPYQHACVFSVFESKTCMKMFCSQV